MTLKLCPSNARNVSLLLLLKRYVNHLNIQCVIPSVEAWKEKICKQWLSYAKYIISAKELCTFKMILKTNSAHLELHT